MASPFAKKTNQINLLPEKEFAGTVTGRILSWIISTFRVIVIATEILVMIAFLSRFWLDAQNTDLNEELDQKKAILSASLDFENQFKDTQKRLRVFANLTSLPPASLYITEITKRLPPEIVLAKISRGNTALQIDGEAANEKSIQQLVTNLNASTLFVETALTDIKSSTVNPGLLTFTIKTVPKGGQAQK